MIFQQVQKSEPLTKLLLPVVKSAPVLLKIQILLNQ